MSSPGPFRANYSVPVTGGRLFVARSGPRPAQARAVVVAVHGITASHQAWRAVARMLPDVCLLAPDLRGRGRSAGLAHERFAAHVDDLIAVLDALEIERAVLAGHSMGAYVVAGLAAEHPQRMDGLVLVDGGLPIEVDDDDDDVDDVLARTLGPALARLDMTFASAAGYVAFWQAHPAFAGPWTDDLDAYVRADLAGAPGALRSVTSGSAVHVDGAALLRDEATRTAADRVDGPLQLLRAPRGILDDDRVLVPDSVLGPFLARHREATAELVEDCNHYTLLMREGAAHVAAAIGRALPASRQLLRTRAA
jgi:pimeloyl-ACP methyl ester carboxylesterase